MSVDSYLTGDARRIRTLAHPEIPKASPLPPVYLIYAVLLRAKGTSVEDEDVHDAWAAAKEIAADDSASLVPYEFLTDEEQLKDRVYADAIRIAAVETDT